MAAITARVTEFVCDNPNATENRTFQIACEYEALTGKRLLVKANPIHEAGFCAQLKAMSSIL
jgi:hypothetical protein